MSTANLLYKEEYPINDQITIRIPTIGEVLEDEDSYNAVLSVWTSTPADYMVFLDDNGIDFTSLNDYDLFLILAQILASYNTSLFFGDLDFSKFRVAEDIERKQMVLLNTGCQPYNGELNGNEQSSCRRRNKEVYDRARARQDEPQKE